MRSPPMTKRFARDGPAICTTSGSPFHMRFTPMSISGYCMKQSSAPMRRSMAVASTAPPPIAAPFQAAMVI